MICLLNYNNITNNFLVKFYILANKNLLNYKTNLANYPYKNYKILQ
jgi:hypothetical protein